MTILSKLKDLKSDQIGDGVYIAFAWIGNADDKRLSCIYIGTKKGGPILQYTSDNRELYNGVEKVDYPDGGWTTLYSRGDFGKRYAYGGHWSAQAKCLHKKLELSEQKDITRDIIMLDQSMLVLPDGISGGDATMTDIDCSVGWAIWYKTAKEALDSRLTATEIQEASLPQKTKIHLLKNESDELLLLVMEVLDVYQL
jgi:hypothetical protein